MAHKFKSIVFHIGPHKTGTSYLQLQLQHAKEALASADIALPSGVVDLPGWEKNHSYLMMALAGRKPNDDLNPEVYDESEVRGMFLVWLKAQTASTLLFSGENASQFDERAWGQLRELLAPFVDESAEVRCLFFARHPLQRALSVRNEMMKSGWACPSSYLLQHQRNGHESLKAFRSVWGDEAVVEVHSYEEAQQDGIWPYFLRTIGLNSEGFPALELNSQAENRSVSLELRWILGTCNPSNSGEFRWMPRKLDIRSGTRDGFTAEEASEVWSLIGEMENVWLAEHGLPPCKMEVSVVNVGSPDLWPEVFLAEWQESMNRSSEEERTFFTAALQRLRDAEVAKAWHPTARERFESLLNVDFFLTGAEDKSEALHALSNGQTPTQALEQNRPKSRQQKWRSAAKLIWSVLEDAVRGHRRWPATRAQLNRLVASLPPAASPPPVAAPPKERAKPQPKKRFQEEDFSIPARENWHADPFSAEHFPALKVLSFHIPKTGGSAFLKCMEASSLEPVCFLSRLGFAPVFEALQALPEADRGLAFANAIASALPREAMAIQGHILFNPMLQPFLMNRSDVMKVTWVREPVAQVHSRYAFVRQVLLRQAPAGWDRPEFADSIFLDVMASCTHPNVKDPQTNILTGLSLEDFDFVGVTECFNEDLAQIDSALGHPGLQPVVANTSKKPRPLTSEEIAAIRDFHTEDVALYERALALRAQRMP